MGDTNGKTGTEQGQGDILAAVRGMGRRPNCNDSGDNGVSPPVAITVWDQLEMPSCTLSMKLYVVSSSQSEAKMRSVSSTNITAASVNANIVETGDT